MDEYGGPYLPDLDFKDLSHDALAGIAELYTRLIRVLDGFWYLTVMDKTNITEATACDITTWKSMIKYELSFITKQLHIQGNGLDALFKTLQFEPMFMQTEYTVDFVNSNEVMMTVTRCPVLEALEKEKRGREDQICRVVEPIIMREYTSYFDPNIEIEPLSLPPRDKPGEICCVWQFLSPKSR